MCICLSQVGENDDVPEKQHKHTVRGLWRRLWSPLEPARTLTRTFRCPVCGRSVEIGGVGGFYPAAVSASEVASQCRTQNGTTHSGRVAGNASPA